MEYGVELIGARIDSIKTAEGPPCCSKTPCGRIGLETPQSQLVANIEDGLAFVERIGYPAILRRASPWAVPAAASPITAKTWSRFSSAGWTFRRSRKC